MKMLLSFLMALAAMTHCTGDADETFEESLAFTPPACVAEESPLVRPDSVSGSAVRPMRFIDAITCTDSSFCQKAMFYYDSGHRVQRIVFTKQVGNDVLQRVADYSYGHDKVSYRMVDYTDGNCMICENVGNVKMDDNGRAVRGSLERNSQTLWSRVSFPLFHQGEDTEIPASEAFRGTVHFVYKYGTEDIMREVLKHVRFGNIESTECIQFYWTLGNLSLTSDSQNDLSYSHSDWPNKTNLDLNACLSYMVKGGRDMTDPLFALIGLYGSRSSLLFSEYTDGRFTYRFHYQLDDDDYVRQVSVERLSYASSAQTDAVGASEAWERIVNRQICPAPADTSVAAAAAREQIQSPVPVRRTFVITYK